MQLKEFFVKLGLDADTASFAAAIGSVDALKLGLVSLFKIGRAAFAGLSAAIFETASQADHIDEISQAAGISAQALQELGYAGSFSSLDIDALAQSMGFLQKNMLSAKQGSEETQKVFARLRVPIKQADGSLRNADDVLMDVADAFASGLVPASEKGAVAMQIFGKSGKKMVPFLNEGRAGLAALRKEANDLGIVMDEAALKAGVELDDAMTKWAASTKGLKKAIGMELIPIVTSAVKWLTEFIKTSGFKSGLKSTIKGIVGVFRGLYNVIWLTYKVIEVFVKALWDGQRVLLLLATAMTALAIRAATTGTIMNMAGIKAALGWAAAAAPVIAIAALFGILFLILEDIAVWLKGGDSLIGQQLGSWKNLTDAVSMMWHDIIDWFTEKLEWIEKKLHDIGDYFSGEFGDGTEKNDIKAFRKREWEKQQGIKSTDSQVKITHSPAPAVARAAATVPQVANAITQAVAPGAIAPPMTQAAASASAAKKGNAPTKNATVHVGGITVVAQPGQAVKDIAEKIREVLSTQLEEAAAATR